MELLLRSFGVLIPIGVLALPFALLAWRQLALRRSRRMPSRVAVTTAGLDVTIVLLGLLVLGVVAMPLPGPDGVNLMPGTDLTIALTENDSFWQVAANIALLLPFGVLLPLRWAWWRSGHRVTIAALLVSIGIESMQYLVGVGRVASTDDVLLNTVGAAAGIALLRRLTPATPRIPAQRTRETPRVSARNARSDRPEWNEERKNIRDQLHSNRRTGHPGHV
ncbi:VanZ family protein [Saccharomonospora sp. NPDC046836]|uniref:VanZ family protein n=1 Tax=Saccharomonospora sp. NPDC046836 TaxID=3156921 RepID=UPI0034071F2B